MEEVDYAAISDETFNNLIEKFKAQKDEEKAKQEQVFKQNESDFGMTDYEAMISMMVDIQNRVTSTVFIDKEYIEARKGVYNLLVKTTGILKKKFKK